jgi:hypothetical protein
MDVVVVKTTPELEMPPSRRTESWDYGFDKGSDICPKKNYA